MKFKPYVVIDGERNYTGLVIDLLDSFKRYPHRFSPQHIPETEIYRENPRKGIEGEIVHFMKDNETLAVILKPVSAVDIKEGKIETHRIIKFPIRRADYAIRHFMKLCESKGCKVRGYLTRNIDMPKPVTDFQKDSEEFHKLSEILLQDGVEEKIKF